MIKKSDEIYYIDSRETTSRKNKANKLFKNTEIKKLSVGDYCYKNVCIELKRADDFIQSVKNKRIFKQAIRMSEEYEIHYIIIYGDMQSAINKTKRYGNYFGVNSYINSLSSLSQVTQILQVKNESQAFKLMDSLFKKSNDGLNRHILTPEKKYRNKMISVLMLIGNMGNKRAEKIIKTLNIKKLNELINLKKDDLLSVDKVGEKTANEILRWLE